MNHRHYYLFAASLIFAACTNAPDSDQADASEAKDVPGATGNETWNLNAAESKIEWIGTKVSGYHTGAVQAKSGEIHVRDGNVVGGKFVMDLVNMSISGPKNVDSGSNAKLLGHLKSADFFDVEKHPEGSFEITDVKAFSGAVTDTADVRQEEINEYKVSNPTHQVSGNLTLKGITKNISFPARITVSGNTAEALAKFNINRKDWNIVYPGKPDDLIRDNIHLGVLIKANK